MYACVVYLDDERDVVVVERCLYATLLERGQLGRDRRLLVRVVVCFVFIYRCNLSIYIWGFSAICFTIRKKV